MEQPRIEPAISARETRRVARELHDRVAHDVSVMLVQAEAAAAVLNADRERAALALAAIAGTGRELLIETRRLLDVLGPSDEATARVPQARGGSEEDRR